MGNKAKYLYVAIAVLLASNGYLLYRLGERQGAATKGTPKATAIMGEYFAEKGVVYGGVSIKKIKMRFDNFVEFNDEFLGEWYSSEDTVNKYYLCCPYGIRQAAGSPYRLIVSLNKNGDLQVIGCHDHEDITREYQEKDFKIFNRAD